MQPTTKIYELIASEFNWEIAEGKTIKAWGFNNTVPGPSIKANKGDTLVIRVKNKLPEPTIVHWHGIRLPSNMDGTDDVQKPIQPGEEFEYRFVVPDAGTFWYHSHQNETEQMEKGMYGSLVVEDKTDPVFDADRVLMIDDMKLTENFEFKKGNVFSRWIERHDGREGNTLLLNGRANAGIEMHEGQQERWRLINASSARYFLLHLEGRIFSIIGTDGGLLESPKQVTEVLITPGERVDIVVGGFRQGEEFKIESLPYNRMTFLKAKRQSFGTVSIKEARPSNAFVPEKLRAIEELATQNTPITRKIKLSVGPSWKRGIDFLVNDELHHEDEPVNMGELQVWEVSNTSMMDHPFHLHGFFFQVLEENGEAPAYKAWKDTYNLKPRSKVKIAWIPDRPGRWMYHCHILEHHAAGMMAHFEVVDPQAGPQHSFHQHGCHAH